MIDGTCTNSAPSYTDDCDTDFGAFAKACNDSAECSWNLLEEYCAVAPTFDTDCSSYFGFEIDCIADTDNCGFFNKFNKEC